MRKRSSLSLLSLVLVGCSSAAFSDSSPEDLESNVSPLGGGPTKPIPTVPTLTSCGTGPGNPFNLASVVWGQEVIPSVVGPGEAFYIEVTTEPGTVSSVSLQGAPTTLGGLATLSFADNGTGRDRVAGDGVFTSTPLWLDTANLPPRLIPGLGYLSIGMVRANLPNGTTREFLQGLDVGFVDQTANRLPTVQTTTRAATNRIAEACTSGWQIQAALRAMNFTSTPSLTSGLYEVVDDNVDHWVWFTTQHLERTNRLSPDNYTAGRHMDVWRQFTGNGRFPLDDRSVHGTTKVRSLNFLDTSARGVYAGNVTHELVHSWSAFVDSSLGITANGDPHYKPRSSVGSLVGGFKWDLQSNGSYLINCNEGGNRATRASDLDLYFMGLLPASAVAPLRVVPDSIPFPGCGQVAPTPHTVVTVQQIIAAHGAVTPGPGQAPTNYRVGFAVEVSGRRLTPNEREFYHRLSEAYTAPLPPGPPPSVGEGWASIAGFFPGSTWSSNLTTH